MRTISNWLVQRVSKPKGYVNPFGVADSNAEDNLRNIMSFDYMGAAEYEHGAISDCLAAMWDGQLEYHDINTPERHTSNFKKIYVILLIDDDDTSHTNRNYDIDDVLRAINNVLSRGSEDNVQVSKGDYGSYYNVLTQASDETYPVETEGWINLKHRYAWFVNEQMAVDFYNHLTQNEGGEDGS